MRRYIMTAFPGVRGAGLAFGTSRAALASVSCFERDAARDPDVPVLLLVVSKLNADLDPGAAWHASVA
jgi:hypothetical protein